MKSNPAQITFAFAPSVVPQGDGSFLVKPGRPVSRLTVAEAARTIGRSKWTVYRLYAAGLISGERTSPRGISIHADSLQAHIERCRDLEFWDDPTRLAHYSGRRHA